jgi:hypothetical protein
MITGAPLRHMGELVNYSAYEFVFLHVRAHGEHVG